MELCSKGNLQDYIKQKRRDKEFLSEYEIIHIIDNILRGIQKINEMDMMHRDIKPGNILRDNENT